MKELEAAVSNINLDKIEKVEKADEKKEKVSRAKPARTARTTRRTGDRTIYDDRRNLSDWQIHLSKTYRDMKKKNPKAKFSDAMKVAKKTYKKKSKK